VSAENKISWYVMRIRPVARLEFQVMHAINQREFPTMVPFREEWIKRRKRRHLVKNPWFPSYVFVGLQRPEQGQWLKESLNRFADDTGKPRPIIGLVGYNADRPAKLTEDNLLTLKRLAEEGPPQIDLTEEFPLGSKIKLMEGPFAGYTATVDGVTESKIQTMVKLFNTMVPIEIDRNAVRAAGVKAA